MVHTYKKQEHGFLLVLMAALAMGLVIMLFTFDPTKTDTSDLDLTANAASTAERTENAAADSALSAAAGSDSSQETYSDVQDLSSPSNSVAAADGTLFNPTILTDTQSLVLIANKSHRLPAGYEPTDLVDVRAFGITAEIAPYLRREAAEALSDMTRAARADGVILKFSSAYRSETYQNELYQTYCAQHGVESADTYSSRPGYSEHQTGLALDFVNDQDSDFTQDFAATKSGKWLLTHAHEYGFLLRYPLGKEEITGYIYEPWHYRYVGINWAQKIYALGANETLEEYFNTSGGTAYAE